MIGAMLGAAVWHLVPQQMSGLSTWTVRDAGGVPAVLRDRGPQGPPKKRRSPSLFFPVYLLQNGDRRQDDQRAAHKAAAIAFSNLSMEFDSSLYS